MPPVAGMAGDLRAWWTGSEGDVNSASVAMARLPKYYTHRRAETELGYAARSVREAAAAAWSWFQAHGYVPERCADGPPPPTRVAAPTAGPARSETAKHSGVCL